MAEPLVSRAGQGTNVAFLAVARESDRMIVAFCSNGAQVDLQGVRAVLDPKAMRRIDGGKHYSFASNSSAWHLVAGDQLIYVAITATSYPTRHAHGLLDDVKKALQGKLVDKALAARSEGGLNADVKQALAKLCAQYDDLSKVDQLHHTLAKVEQVKVVMQDSIEIALQNCVSLESIDQKADELQSQAGMFKTRAKKLRSQMWWKKCKVQLMLTALILVVLACIIIPMVIYFKGGSSSSSKK